MKSRAWGTVLLLTVVLLLSGCLGSLPNLLPPTWDVTLDEPLLSSDAQFVEISGIVENTSNRTISVVVSLWLVDEDGVTLGDDDEIDQIEVKNIRPGEKRPFEEKLPVVSGWESVNKHSEVAK